MQKILVRLVFTLLVTNIFCVEARDNKMITVAMSKFDDLKDPVDAFSYQQFIIIQCMHDTLVNLVESGDIESEIAKDWKVSTDGLVYEFTLKDNLKFQDGSIITSEDVAFSLSRHLWKGSQSIVKYYLESIQGPKELVQGEVAPGIQIVSPNKFKIELKRVTPSFLYILSMPSFSIISKKAFAKKQIIGSGRMSLKEEKGNMWLETWNEYQGDKPKLEKISIIQYSNPQEIESQIENKTLDIVLGLSKDFTKQLKTKDFQKDSVKSLTYTHFFYNLTKNPLFKNIEFRKDLTHLIQNVAKKVSDNDDWLEFLPNYFPKGVMSRDYYKKEIPETNISEFSEKWTELSKKYPVKIALFKDAFPEEFVTQLKEVLKKVALNSNVELVTNTKRYYELLASKNYDVIDGGYMGNFPDPDGFIEPLVQGTDFSFGVTPINSMLKEIDKINQVRDKYKRLELYSNLFKNIEEQYFYAPVFRDKFPLLHKKGINLSDTSYRYESELWKIFWKN